MVKQRSMKNRTFFLIFLLIYNINYSQQNGGIIIYKKRYLEKQDTLSDNSLFKRNKKLYDKISKTTKETNKILKKLEFELKFDNENALFKIKPNMKLESNMFYGFALGPYGGRIFYSSNKDKNGSMLIEEFGEKFLIKKDKKKWKLTSMKKKVGDFMCYKATTVQKT